jgi:hypothetical protein
MPSATTHPTIWPAIPASPTHQLPPAIAIPIANPGLSAPFRSDDPGRHHRFEDGANGGFADHGPIDESVVTQGLHLAVDTLAGAGRIRGGTPEQQKREYDKNRGHADLVTIPASRANGPA